MIYFVDLAFYLKFTSLCIFNKWCNLSLFSLIGNYFSTLQEFLPCWVQWLTAIIPAIWEAEIRRITIWGQP
jgi:hypothetical protein